MFEDNWKILLSMVYLLDIDKTMCAIICISKMYGLTSRYFNAYIGLSIR